MKEASDFRELEGANHGPHEAKTIVVRACFAAASIRCRDAIHSVSHNMAPAPRIEGDATRPGPHNP
ncbi:MAG TPA: hypothetical protein VE029_08340 [Rhizobacter sp.]|nr:hypothetical protein [Rhizobacter sp.]